MQELQRWLARVPDDDRALDRRRSMIASWKAGDLRSHRGVLYFRDGTDWRIFMTPTTTPWDEEGLPDDLVADPAALSGHDDTADPLSVSGRYAPNGGFVETGDCDDSYVPSAADSSTLLENNISGLRVPDERDRDEYRPDWSEDWRNH